MKKCPTSLDIREKQVKTTPESSFLVRMAVLISAGEDEEKREPPHTLLAGMWTCIATVVITLDELRRELSVEQPSIPALGRFSKNYTLVHRSTLYTDIYCSIHS